MTTWKDISRLAGEAKGADRHFDAQIMAHLKGGKIPRWMGDPPGYYWASCPFRSPELTSSVDAILALIGENLPGWQWMLRGGWAKVWSPPELGMQPNDFQASGATPALALTAAFALAMDAMEREGEKT